MKLSIIIPVFNEERTVKEILSRVRQVKLNKEIIVVDDCSTDNTIEVLNKIKGIKIIKHKKNQGKGGAIRTGLSSATGDVLTIQDADLEYEPHEFERMLKVIEEGKSQVVYGSRFMGKRLEKKQFKIPTHYIGNVSLSVITSILFRKWVSDMETCYKMMTREVYEKIELKSKGFEIEPEITAQIIKKGYSIHEIPISYHPRNWKEGKKINWKDGIKAAAMLIKQRLTP